MARKLKTYTTSVGFFDLAVAAPSMKAALEAWGSKMRQRDGAAPTNGAVSLLRGAHGGRVPSCQTYRRGGLLFSLAVFPEGESRGQFSSELNNLTLGDIGGGP